MLYFKLKVKRNSISIMGVTDSKKDDGFVYATAEELKLLNQDILENFNEGVTDFIVEK